MKTVKLTEKEIATLKAAVWGQLQNINRDIRIASETGKDTSILSEMKRDLETAFEALSFAQ
ncbi:hypothetical protein [Parageobacillus sp. G301]|uniref:hypothetical protein n=1 Tax=Parageobacillus sp. G301 TaxID=2998290 RepID=UPI002498B34E|nr:hypothetical protein [Parageobacillus sp. G301]GLH62375.1 hypothetical protein PG301_02150 [Parageobacillus sp. G301]